MLTTAERLRREGEARGRVEGKRAALLLQLRERFGRLPAPAVAGVDDADSALLDVWFRRVLTATSLEDVLGAKVPVRPNEAPPPTRARPRTARPRTRR